MLQRLQMTMASCCVHSVSGDEHEEIQVLGLLRLWHPRKQAQGPWAADDKV
jgi:hypothetical protein